MQELAHHKAVPGKTSVVVHEGYDREGCPKCALLAREMMRGKHPTWNGRPLLVGDVLTLKDLPGEMLRRGPVTLSDIRFNGYTGEMWMHAFELSHLVIEMRHIAAVNGEVWHPDTSKIVPAFRITVHDGYDNMTRSSESDMAMRVQPLRETFLSDGHWYTPVDIHPHGNLALTSQAIVLTEQCSFDRATLLADPQIGDCIASVWQNARKSRLFRPFTVIAGSVTVKVQEHDNG